MSPQWVLLPISIIWVCFIAVYRAAASRDRRVPADDLGVLFLLVLSIYSTLPPLAWLSQGGEYRGVNSGRLLLLQPSADDVFYLSALAMTYSLAFAAAYLWRRRKIRPASSMSIPYIRNEILAGAVTVSLFCLLAGAVISLGGGIRRAESYIDTYRAIAELPLAFRQLIKITGGILSIAQLVVLVALLQRWPRSRYWLALYLGAIFFSFDPDGSRASLITGVLGLLVGWHLLVRPLPRSQWIAIVVLGLTGFLILGFVRAIGSVEGISGSYGGGMPLGEFDVLWANAVQLLHERARGGLTIPFAALYGEWFAFIPGQLLPFEKSSLADWFLSTFHSAYKVEGGGLAFGALSQVVVGGGFLEALIRGLLLGVLAAWLVKWSRRPEKGWWRFPLYLYLLVFSFQTIRSSTFYLLGDVVQIAFPGFLAISLLGRLLPKRAVQKSNTSHC